MFPLSVWLTELCCTCPATDGVLCLSRCCCAVPLRLPSYLMLQLCSAELVLACSYGGLPATQANSAQLCVHVAVWSLLQRGCGWSCTGASWHSPVPRMGIQCTLLIPIATVLSA